MKTGAVVLTVLLAVARTAAAATLVGQVTFMGLPVPGATITAVAVVGGQRASTVTDDQGRYRLANLADGAWTVRVEMLGFATLSDQEVASAAPMARTWALTLLSFDQITRSVTTVTPEPEGAASPTLGAGEKPDAGDVRPMPNAAQDVPSAANPDAADSLLVNGSVNNGAASPFAQLAAFGNNRRNLRSQYNWGFGTILGDSALDARPFSFAGVEPPKPAYTDVQGLVTFGGPIKLPWLQNRANVLATYQRTSAHTVTTEPALVPSLLERAGDFSQSFDAFGRPVRIVDPATGQPFAGDVVPAGRISPQAAALLALYPAPNVEAGGRYNYQAPVLVATHQDSVQSRIVELVNNRNQVFGTVGYQRTATETGNLFGFVDASLVTRVTSAINWSHRFSPFTSVRLNYQFGYDATEDTPYFAGRVNVSGEAGITGNDQQPVNWGPPALVFSSGVAGLSTAPYASDTTWSNGWLAELLSTRGRHNVTVGASFTLQRYDLFEQQDARGTFAFTGAATGSDVADFLLGLPDASSIAFGNPDKYLRQSVSSLYVNDDWRVSPSFTFNLGLRWEYESPVTEARNRLVNLDIAPGFSRVGPVLASNPVGPLTLTRYPDSLVEPDRRGVEPRLAVAWRPVAGSSLVVRAGYGIYRNTSVYESLAKLLAQQPPLSTTISVETSAANPLTLANGFVAPPATANTFAVDPAFRVGSVQNWQVSVQRDLPWSLTVTGTYLGAKGSHLMQETLPNTYAPGAVNPCPACPTGFVYLTSNGSSLRNAGQIQLRRRLRAGLTATVEYTLSKATDDAAASSGAALTGSAIAQNWQDLAADWGPSRFDQRHLLTAQVQYTTGMGLGGGALAGGLAGSLFKGWTITGQLTTGSGLPFTPIVLVPVSGTGMTGSVRASLTGASTEAPSGYYANPAAYRVPAAGQWGNAGRNSARGPAQFSLDAGLGRSFLLSDRLTLDWRLDATNVLNRVTYASVNPIVGSPQFGLPTQSNPMRRIQTTVRLRF